MSKRKAIRPKATSGKARRSPRTAATRTETPASDSEDSSSQPTRSGLKPQIHDFCLVYLTNGFNASAAYKASHPDCQSDHAARSGGHRLLTNSDVKAFLASQLDQAWKAKQMSGEEALALVANDARADLRLLYDEKGALLHPKDWPDDIANAVESAELDGDGCLKVKLVSKAASRRTILEVTGKIKGSADGIDDLAEALKATLEQNQKFSKG